MLAELVQHKFHTPNTNILDSLLRKKHINTDLVHEKIKLLSHKIEDKKLYFKTFS